MTGPFVVVGCPLRATGFASRVLRTPHRRPIDWKARVGTQDQTGARAQDRAEQRARRAALATGAAIGAAAAAGARGAQARELPGHQPRPTPAPAACAARWPARTPPAGPDTITFTGAGASGEISLTTGEIAITDDLTITGPGAGALSVSGDADNDNVRDFATGNVTLGDSRIFAITGPDRARGRPSRTVTISGLTLKEGVADFFSGGTPQPRSGGAIYSEQTALDARPT